MDYFDMLRELRSGNPDTDKTAKTMKILGWLCLAGAIWNFAFYYLAPFAKAPFNLPPGFPYFALISLAILGGLFLYASRAIRETNPWGRTAGQMAIVLSVALIVGFSFFVACKIKLPIKVGRFSVVFNVFAAVFIAQFVVPAYYGFRYLGRLPITPGTLAGDSRNFKPATSKESLQNGQGEHEPYKDALFPFGVFGTFVLLLAVAFMTFFLIGKLGGAPTRVFMHLPVFMVIFCAPIAYNYCASPFEERRKMVASFTGGGSIFLFSGTWPFFRVIIYADGLEVRVMFHRYFIPFEKMDNLPEKIGFFSRGLLIRSNLPGVPSGIRYQGFGMKKVLAVIKRHQENAQQKAKSRS